MSILCYFLVLFIAAILRLCGGEEDFGFGDEVWDEDKGASELVEAARQAAFKESALGYHGSAMERINANDYHGALPYFHLAVRLDPGNAGYWNDLGVTEMRIGELHGSKTRFLRALEVDPSFSVAYENIAELKTYLGDADFNAGLKRRGGLPAPTEHHIEEPPEMDADEFFKLTIQDDVRDPSILGGGPIVVRRAAQSWGWNLDHPGSILHELSALFGNERVDYYPHNMKVHTVSPYFSALNEAVEALTAPNQVFGHVDVSEPGTYIQWNVREVIWRELLASFKFALPAVFDDTHWTSRCFNATQDHNQFNINVHWKMLLIAESGAGMFNHKDVLRMASWQVNLAGRKRWHICSPTQDEFMSVHMNVLYPDYATFPQLRNASCFSTIVDAGDMLYYPRDWWHQTENLDTPTIALSGSMVNHHNYKEFAEELKKECSDGGSGRNRIFVANSDVCGDIDRCADVWGEMYTGENSDEL